MYECTAFAARFSSVTTRMYGSAGRLRRPGGKKWDSVQVAPLRRCAGMETTITI